jgi:lipopolysaccharide export system protein LptA
MSTRQASAEGTKELNVKRLDGDVQIRQGTMHITADRAVVRERPQGVTAELFGNAERQVSFRQKREGVADFVEAWADRAEYDETSGALRLYSRVKFKNGTDVVNSEYMQYNTNTEKTELSGRVPGTARPADDGSRVVFEVQPRQATRNAPAKK